MNTTQTTATRQIKIDGRAHNITNAYSSGPGNSPHTYDIGNGCHVYEIAGSWSLQRPGQHPVQVTVETA